MSNCASCKHFRSIEPERAARHALRWLTHSPLSHDTNVEFTRIADAERKQWEAETNIAEKHKIEICFLMDTFRLNLSAKTASEEQRVAFDRHIRPLLSRGPFNSQPRAISHCMADADRGSYHLPEVRNWGDSCVSGRGFEAGDRRPDCSACRFYRKSDTEQRLLAQARYLRQMIRHGNGAGADELEHRARGIESSIDCAKAQDLREAYDADGTLQRPLEYLPTCMVPCSKCAALSEPVPNCPDCRLYQPEIYNRSFQCRSFQPSGPSAGPSTLGPERLRHTTRRTPLDEIGMGGNFRADRQARKRGL